MSWPALPPHHRADRQSLAAQAEPGWSPTLPELADPDGSRHTWHRPVAAFPPFPPLRLGKAREARRAPRTMRRARTARPLTPQPLPGAQDEMASWLGGAAQPGGRGFREPVCPGAVRFSLWAAARVRLCDRLQPLGARVPPLPLRPGLQTAPARLCASFRPPAQPGDEWGTSPKPQPATTAPARASEHPVQRLPPRPRLRLPVLA